MVTGNFSARYTTAMLECGERSPIEAGVVGRLADNECRHGRLPLDRTSPCGCWPEAGAPVLSLPRSAEQNVSSRRAA